MSKNTLSADGCLFDEATIDVELGGSVHFKNCYFKDCHFHKVGGWWVNWYSSKWTFENCVFDDYFFTRWSTTDHGVKITNCTFNKIDLAKYDFREGPYSGESSKHTFLKDCRFVRCEVPVGAWVLTVDGVFDACKFIETNYNKPPKNPIEIRAVLLNQRTKLPSMPELITVTTQRADNGAGANLILP